MKPVSNPEPCPNCDGQLFKAIWSLYAKDEDGNRDFDGKPDPYSEEGTDLRQDGVECVECGCVQLHRYIPNRHVDKEDLSLPESADRDFVREE